MKWLPGLLSGLLGFAWAASAVTDPIFGVGIPGARSPVKASRHGTARGRSRIARLLASDVPAERIAGDRGAIARGDEISQRLLAQSITDAKVERTEQEDLTLARALAPHAKDPTLRRLLAHLAFSAGARQSPAEPLRHVALQTGLLALAWSQSDDAIRDLGRALKSGGALAEAASEALLVYPPDPFARLLDSSVPRSADWCRLLGRAGHASAIPSLRTELLNSTGEMQLAAAEGLLALGDRAMAPLLVRWRDDPRAADEFKRLATTEQQATKETSSFDEPAMRAWPVPPDAKPLLSWLDTPRVLPKRLAASTDGNEQYRLLTALLLATYRTAGAPTLSPDYLRDRLDDPRLSFAAAALLARQADPTIVRLLQHRSPMVERAVAWALPYLDEASPLLETIAALIAVDNPSHGTSPLCVGLVQPQIRNALARNWLLARAQSESFCAPLAAEALAALDGHEIRSVLRALLEAPHPLMRSAVARGLGLSLDPTASGLLLGRFEIEENVWVRRAILRSLRHRNSGLGAGLLREMALFEPDPLARHLARESAVANRTTIHPQDPLDFWIDATTPVRGGTEIPSPRASAMLPVVLSLPPSDPKAAEPRNRIVIASGPDGASLPIVADPTGLVLLPHATRGLHLESYAL